jgi:DNA repair photolyase
MSHKTSGTQEWAKNNLNIQEGCFNNCFYCYALRMAKRFKRVKNSEEWCSFPTIKIKKVHKGYRKIENPNPNLYDYMFPTTHDIFPENLYYCLKTLKKILKAGNSVLITTKPTFYCIKQLINELEGYKDQTCFRFTITSYFDSTIKKYEPNAPNFMSRRESLKYAYNHNFKTSLSLEPLLDLSPLWIIEKLQKYVNDEIWIGIMSGEIPEELKENYSIKNLKQIYRECKNLPLDPKNKIRFKDSIVNKLKLKKNHF